MAGHPMPCTVPWKVAAKAHQCVKSNACVSVWSQRQFWWWGDIPQAGVSCRGGKSVVKLRADSCGPDEAETRTQFVLIPRMWAQNIFLPEPKDKTDADETRETQLL